ncbi:SAM-dependent methyltransferase [Novosphingobium sp. FSW06-99]|nr:SAM-dependent methyltransferase [Novosphingobium sp. FSW06-99]
MTTPDQDHVIQRQFGAAAADYVTSPVHAGGADLARIAAIAAKIRPEHALDLGTGGGHVAYALAPHATRVTACDLSEAMLAVVADEAVRRGLPTIATLAASVGDLPMADAACDMVACRFSLHHWRDPAAGLAQARRVLRPGGPAVFVDVIAPAAPAADTHLQTVELLRDPSHVRDFTVREWQAMLAEAGFAITAIVPAQLRMDFAEWTARQRTPPVQAAAIRAVQALAPAEVAHHFAIEPDGSFTLDTVLIEAV